MALVACIDVILLVRKINYSYGYYIYLLHLWCCWSWGVGNMLVNLSRNWCCCSYVVLFLSLKEIPWDCPSNSKILLCGITQGSISSPILGNVYMTQLGGLVSKYGLWSLQEALYFSLFWPRLENAWWKLGIAEGTLAESQTSWDRVNVCRKQPKDIGKKCVPATEVMFLPWVTEIWCKMQELTCETQLLTNRISVQCFRICPNACVILQGVLQRKSR